MVKQNNKISIESNNGGSYIEFEQLDDECIQMSVGHNCCIIFNGQLPAYVLAELIDRGLTSLGPGSVKINKLIERSVPGNEELEKHFKRKTENKLEIRFKE